jgi:predicted RNA binding protein YcfA (HicA-like mRNA interferase family)
MSRLPQVTPRKMIAALQRAGFVIVGSKGGHHYLEYKNDPTRWTTVSVHPGDMAGGTVRAILKQTGLSREEFLKLL